jgi:hypothetical protein
MEGKGRIRGTVLNAAVSLAMAIISGCASMDSDREIFIRFHTADPSSRSMPPDEELISDISLMIFDESGSAEECIWLDEGESSCKVRLAVNRKYTFCACANFGYQVYADHMDELEEITFRMAYPDEYREGIPMYAMKEILVTEGSRIDISLERLMARISIRMDRSRLREDVEMNVRSARIGNCPRLVKVFGRSRLRNGDECFPAGFTLNDLQTASLNDSGYGSLSPEVSLYMLENMQGDSDMLLESDSGKVFEDDDPRKEVCSYIELEIEYMSADKKSNGKGLIYRFYLGEDRQNFDIERNCHYHITVTPEGDGLGEDGWRVDKSGIEDIGQVSFASYPSSYIRGDIGDIIHLWCEFNPPYAPFDVGLDYLEDDKAEGIYDYTIDEDGHGVTLTLTGPGTGLIYMEAGEPVNDAALFIIEVNLPAGDSTQ